MDWLEEQLEKFQLKERSLMASLALYIISAIMIVTLLYFTTTIIVISYQRILLGQTDEMNNLLSLLKWQPPQALPKNLSPLYDSLQYVRGWSLVLFTVIAVFLVVFLFYDKKIRQPILLLQRSIAQIKEGNLLEPIHFVGNLEFNAIISGFDKMRKILITDKKQILSLYEEQRKINATFSHDIRTPLAIIQSNIDLIRAFKEADNLTDEQLERSLSKMETSNKRLEQFSQTMQTIQKIDEIDLVKEFQSLQKLVDNTQAIIETTRSQETVLVLDGDFSQRKHFDLQIITEVIENLFSNSRRFAASKITITFQLSETYLTVTIQDDGKGFVKEALVHAKKPYYSHNHAQQLGLGLTISEVLTNKHGGILKLANSIHGGAIVTAIFSV